MASVSTAPTTVADRIRASLEKAKAKAETKVNEPRKISSKVIQNFFNQEVRATAELKITDRLNGEKETANLLEYDFYECVKFNTDGKTTVRVKDFYHRDGAYVHRIHYIVQSAEFKAMMDDFVKEIGFDNMTWWSGWIRGRDRLNVVSVNWMSPEDRAKKEAVRKAKYGVPTNYEKEESEEAYPEEVHADVPEAEAEPEEEFTQVKSKSKKDKKSYTDAVKS